MPVAGAYLFTLTSTDGSRLTIIPSPGDNLVVVDNDGALKPMSGTMASPDGRVPSRTVIRIFASSSIVQMPAANVVPFDTHGRTYIGRAKLVPVDGSTDADRAELRCRDPSAPERERTVHLPAAGPLRDPGRVLQVRTGRSGLNVCPR